MDTKLVLMTLLTSLLIVSGCTGIAQNDQEIDAQNASDSAKREIVVFQTNKGMIEIELNREMAPVTVENFVNYVKDGHYNGTIFHRVIRGFMIQGGGFSSTGGEKPTRPPIKLESNNSLKNVEGTIAMARTSNPNSATAQFFINTADNAALDYTSDNPGYAVFGKVISGMDIVKQIEMIPTTNWQGYDDWPEQPVIITGAYLKGES